MSTLFHLPLYALTLLGLGATAWAAPGEDPILLTKPAQYLQLPIASGGASSNPDSAGGLPSNVKAKIARLEAKSFSAMADSIYTDADIQATVTAGQQKKTCIQDVGSNTSSNGALRYGPGNSKQQIVVLRGDLVNICN